MSSISKTIYASDASVEVSKKMLNSGEFVQLKISYAQPETEHRGVYDNIIVTLSISEAYDLAQTLLTKGAPS